MTNKNTKDKNNIIIDPRLKGFQLTVYRETKYNN